MKKPGLWEPDMVTGETGQKPDWKKWPCLSDSDMVTGGLNLVCETVVWSLTFMVENLFEKKKLKKNSLWDYGMVTGGPGQKPDLKKWPGLSDSDMVTGG